MWRLSLSKWLGNLGFGILLFGATVMAQPAEGTDPDAALRRGSSLNPQEQQAQADGYIEKMKTILNNVNRTGERARADRDIIKLNCVNDKLIQIKGHLNLAEQTREQLKVSIARHDEASRNHEFAKLTITYQKVVILGQETEACIGEDIAYVGTTKVDIQVDPDIPVEDPTVEPPPGVVVDRPADVSPHR